MGRRADSQEWRHVGEDGLFEPYREYGFDCQILIWCLRKIAENRKTPKTLEFSVIFGFDLALRQLRRSPTPLTANRYLSNLTVFLK